MCTLVHYYDIHYLTQNTQFYLQDSHPTLAGQDTHICHTANPYLTHGRYGFHGVEIWVSFTNPTISSSTSSEMVSSISSHFSCCTASLVHCSLKLLIFIKMPWLGLTFPCLLLLDRGVVLKVNVSPSWLAMTKTPSNGMM